MHPNAQEIEKVGNAFISIGYLDYTPEQHHYLMNFLRDYGLNLNEALLKKVFYDKMEIVEAIKILHQFSTHYQDEKEVYPEFRNEMEELIVTLNGKEESIII